MTSNSFRCAHCSGTFLDIHAFFAKRGNSRVAMCATCAKPALMGEVLELSDTLTERKRQLAKCEQHINGIRVETTMKKKTKPAPKEAKKS